MVKKPLLILLIAFSNAPVFGALATSELVSDAVKDTDSTFFTTASISPTANARVLIGIVAHKAATPENPTFTGTNWANGRTWVLEDEIDVTHVDGGGVAKLQVYSTVAPGSVTGGTITATFANAHEKFIWQVVEWTDTVTPEIVQSKAVANAGDATATLDAAPQATNGAWGFSVLGENTSMDWLAPITDSSYIFDSGTPPVYTAKGGYDLAAPNAAAVMDVAATVDNTGVIYLEIGQPPESGLVRRPNLSGNFQQLNGNMQ